MIRINLLPFRAARKQENVKRQVTVFFLVFALTVVAMFAVHLWLGNMVGEREKKMADTQTQLAKVQKQAEEVKALQAHLAMVQKRLDVIQTLMADRSYPVKLLDSMTQWTVTDRMWLESLESTKEKLSLVGIAVDENTVSVFHKRLEKSGQFVAVSLDRMTKSTTYPGLNFQEFWITCFKPVKEEPKEAAKGEAGKGEAAKTEAGKTEAKGGGK